jgi:hypothetical protein
MGLSALFPIHKAPMLPFIRGRQPATLLIVLAIGQGCFLGASSANGQVPDDSEQVSTGFDWEAAEAAASEGIETPEWIDPEALRTIEGSDGDACAGELCIPRRRRFTEYRQHEAILSYMPGNGDQLGWIDLEPSPYIGRDEKSGLMGGIGLHLLSGPISVALPPRLWDFNLGYQIRDTISDRFSYDLAVTAGVYSDFEDSARDGVRFPAHAVGIVHMSESLDLVGGVDYLDRDDYRILPVIGYSWCSEDFPNWNVDMVFPRPRVQFALNDTKQLYIRGLLGGGTWDIEMPDEANDVVTYRDFQLLFGLEQVNDDGTASSFELGYVFGRKVELRTSPQDHTFDDAFIVRWVRRL